MSSSAVDRSPSTAKLEAFALRIWQKAAAEQDGGLVPSPFELHTILPQWDLLLTYYLQGFDVEWTQEEVHRSYPDCDQWQLEYVYHGKNVTSPFAIAQQKLLEETRRVCQRRSNEKRLRSALDKEIIAHVERADALKCKTTIVLVPERLEVRLKAIRDSGGLRCKFPELDAVREIELLELTHAQRQQRSAGDVFYELQWNPVGRSSKPSTSSNLGCCVIQ
jgi:hypothetical protein